MADEPFVGDVIIWPMPFAPRGWAFCRGQLLSINQNQVLFALLGARYGGNGQTTFALPDLRGRSIMGSLDGAVGQVGGSATISVNTVNVAPGSGPMVARATPDGVLNNRSEYIALNYIIALQGVFPSRN